MVGTGYGIGTVLVRPSLMVTVVIVWVPAFVLSIVVVLVGPTTGVTKDGFAETKHQHNTKNEDRLPVSLPVAISGCGPTTGVVKPGGGVSPVCGGWGKHKALWPSIKPASASALKVEIMFAIGLESRMKLKSGGHLSRNSCCLFKLLRNRSRT